MVWTLVSYTCFFMKQSLKDRILSYFTRHPDLVVASGEFQRIVADKTTYTPSNVSRRLRELENEGKLEVTYKKGHAHYSIKR